MQVSPIVLVTGFEPFGGERINPSWEIAKALPSTIGSHHVVTQRVPTAFGDAIAALAKLISKHQPSLVLCLGQAGGRSSISVERVAINVNDARIADNAGYQPIDQAIVGDAPAAYFSTLPIKAMVAAMQKKGIPAEVSNTAGTFVCNHIMYGALHHIATQKLAARAGFIHVPYLPSQVVNGSAPTMALSTMQAGIEIAIDAAIRTKQDRKLVGGKLD
jgi:pyroglutamyl-peptidase